MKRWQVVLISILAVGITPFVFSLASTYVFALLTDWPHWQKALPDLESIVIVGLLSLMVGIPYGCLVSLIAQIIYRQFYPSFFSYLAGMALVGFIAFILISMLIPFRLHHEDDPAWAVSLIGISTLVCALVTYGLNARFCPQPPGNN